MDEGNRYAVTLTEAGLTHEELAASEETHAPVPTPTGPHLLWIHAVIREAESKAGTPVKARQDSN